MPPAVGQPFLRLALFGAADAFTSELPPNLQRIQGARAPRTTARTSSPNQKPLPPLQPRALLWLDGPTGWKGDRAPEPILGNGHECQLHLTLCKS